MKTLRDLNKLNKLAPRKFAAEVGKLARKALREGDCGRAHYFLHLGKMPKIMRGKAWATLRARVESCYIKARGGTV